MTLDGDEQADRLADDLAALVRMLDKGASWSQLTRFLLAVDRRAYDRAVTDRAFFEITAQFEDRAPGAGTEPPA